MTHHVPRRFAAFLPVALAMLPGHTAVSAANLTNLRCEYLADPHVIHVAKPRLSWVIESGLRGERQTVYHVLVALTPELLAKDLIKQSCSLFRRFRNLPVPIHTLRRHQMKRKRRIATKDDMTRHLAAVRDIHDHTGVVMAIAAIALGCVFVAGTYAAEATLPIETPAAADLTNWDKAVCDPAAATLARPDSAQYAWHEQERIMFIHFGVATWEGSEYDADGKTDLSKINPAGFDADKICAVAQSWGAKQILLVCKHVGGFCWWPTETTDYCVKNIPWRDGRGNLVREVAEACRRRTLKMGIYIYSDDPNFMSGFGYGGRTSDPAQQEEWNRRLRQQWTEVLTLCGKDLVQEIWFDGSCIVPLDDIIKKLAPNAVILQSPMTNIRWVGNEAGIARDPNWNTLNRADLKSGVATEAHSTPQGDAWAPVECDVTLYNHNWFWNPGNERKRRTLDQLMNLYMQSVGRGSVLLLNSTPNTDGLIPEGDQARYQEFGEAIEQNFGHPVGRMAKVAGSEVVIPLGNPQRVNGVDLWEDYQHGHRIRRYETDVRVNGEWRRVAEGAAVGRRKIDLFPDVMTDAIRVRVTEQVGTPLFRQILVHTASPALVAALGQIPSVTRGAIASASSIQSDPFSANNVNDGDTGSRWSETGALAILSRLPSVLAADQPTEVKLARPTAQQYAWQEQERIMFVCLDPCTWQGREYDNHSTQLSAINPAQLDTDQWCRAAKLWGAKEILFVAKHTGGFCWWQTETTKYGIKDAAWKGGKGDVLAELSASCRREGLNLGVYVYPGDDTWDAPMGSGGRTKDPSKQDAYNKVFRQQLTEVLTRYGKVAEVWFDGSCVIDISDILKQHAAEAVIFQGPQATIRWPGTESGKLPYPAWNSVKSQDLRTGVSTAAHGDPDGDAWAPLETNTTLYDHFWFWAAGNEKKRKSLQELMDCYYKSVGRGSVFLLNSTPNTDGLIPENDLKLYAAFGEEIERRFSRPVVEIRDQRGTNVELDLPRPTLINHVVLMEDYREGERIRSYVVEGLSDRQWKELSQGTSVGRMKIDRFRPALVSRVRLRITKAAAEPILRRFATFQVEGVSAGSLTTGRPTTASTFHSSPFVASMATDDDQQTRWGCPDDTRACWLEVDLGEPMAFGRVAINELADRIRKFTLDYRDTSQAPWQTAFAGTMAGATFQQDFLTVTGRFVRLNITEASGPPTIWEFNVHPGEPGWERCGAWTAESFRDGKAGLTLDLSPFIRKPGQFEVKFVQTGGEQALRITKTTLLYEGEEATPGLLTRLDGMQRFNVNRTAQVTKETSSVLKVEITPSGGSDCQGTVWIRPRPTE